MDPFQVSKLHYEMICRKRQLRSLLLATILNADRHLQLRVSKDNLERVGQKCT
jgi:hypothetical protein